MFRKGQVRLTLILFEKVQDEKVEMNLVPESFISGLQRKKSQGDKWLRLLSDGVNKTDPIY